MSFEILNLNQTKKEKIEVFINNTSGITVNKQYFDNIKILFESILDKYEYKINVLYSYIFSLSFVDKNGIAKNLKDMTCETYLFQSYNEICDRIECSDNFFIYDMSIIRIPDLNNSLVEKIYLRGYSLGFTDKIILLQKG